MTVGQGDREGFGQCVPVSLQCNMRLLVPVPAIFVVPFPTRLTATPRRPPPRLWTSARSTTSAHVICLARQASASLRV